MSYLLLLTENVSSKPSLTKGVISSFAEKKELWDFYKALAFRYIVKEVLQCWPLTDEYEDVVNLNPVKWYKDGKEYVVVCLDRDRVNLTNPQLVSERDDLEAAGIPMVAQLVEDPVVWRIENGYTLPVEG